MTPHEVPAGYADQDYCLRTLVSTHHGGDEDSWCVTLVSTHHSGDEESWCITSGTDGYERSSEKTVIPHLARPGVDSNQDFQNHKDPERIDPQVEALLPPDTRYPKVQVSAPFQKSDQKE